MAASARLVGYQRKPVAIHVIALIFLALPAVLMAQVVALAGGRLDIITEVFGSTFFLQEWLLCWSAAAAIYIVTTWSLVYFVGLTLFTLMRRLSALAYYPELDTGWGLISTAVWLGVAAFVLFSTVKTPYLNPKLRWWTRPARVPISRRAVLKVGAHEIPATVLNLSVGGVFLKVDESVAEQAKLPERLGEMVALIIDLGPDAAAGMHLEVAGELCWRTRPDSGFKYGMGLKFVGLPPATRRQIKRLLRDAARTAGGSGR